MVTEHGVVDSELLINTLHMGRTSDVYNLDI